MHKYIKTGILILLLVVPVLIFLFLKGFATNHYDLPYYVPARDLITNEVVITEGDTAFYQIQPFSISNNQGQNITSDTLNNKTSVIGPLPFPCGDTCRQIMTSLNRVARLNKTYPQFRIFGLVNEKSKELLDQDGGLNPDWQMLSVQDSVYSFYLNDVFHLTEKNPGQKTISINSRFILVDRLRHIRGYYDLLDPEDLDRLLVEIKVLEYNREEDK